MESHIKLLAIYLIAVNVIAFPAYGIDKLKAKANAWRIPEKTLIGLGVLGGFAGALLAMKLFHHKTRHGYFWAANILSLVLWAFIIWRIAK